MDVMNDFINVLKNTPNGAYDFICNHYYEMGKDDLQKVTKELLYAIHTNTDTAKHNKILDDVAEELLDNYR